jgi:hypothetical protein
LGGEISKLQASQKQAIIASCFGDYFAKRGFMRGSDACEYLKKPAVEVLVYPPLLSVFIFSLLSKFRKQVEQAISPPFMSSQKRQIIRLMHNLPFVIILSFLLCFYIC